jgi:LysM repeat protein
MQKKMDGRATPKIGRADVGRVGDRPTARHAGGSPRRSEAGNRSIKLPGGAKRRPAANPRLIYIAGIFALIVIIIGTVWLFTRKNAFEVYVGDDVAGIIPNDKSVTQQSVRDMAIAKLETEVGARVRVDETIALKPVHASKKKMSTAEYVIGAIYDKWPYLVEAAIINVDGLELAALKTDAESEDVLRQIAEQYVGTDAKLIDYEYAEKVETVKKFIKPSAIIAPEQALETLNKSTEADMVYEVRQGDTLSKISAQADMTVDEILAANEGLNLLDNLNIGQRITLITQKPIVSVKTVEETTRTDVAAKETETRENPRQPVGYSKVIQQGRDGQKEITLHISRLNGIEVSKDIVNERIIVEPITEVVEKGALEEG